MQAFLRHCRHGFAVPRSRASAFCVWRRNDRDFGPQRKAAGLRFFADQPSSSSSSSVSAADRKPSPIVKLRQAHRNQRLEDRFWELPPRSAPVEVERRKPGLSLQAVVGALQPARLSRTVYKHFLSHFLPESFPESVTAPYLRFAVWHNLGFIASSANGVLATQAMLLALGLSASQALPAAAALNWVIKDGLGQLGGILVASRVNTLFDTNPKTWRMIAALSLQLSSLVELLTSLVPSLFLPMAACANIGKNVSFLASSASKATILKSFIRQENLGDLYAKSGAQAIASSLIGMGFGVGLGAVLANKMTLLAPVFLSLAAMHLFGEYKSTSVVVLTGLNLQRLDRVCEHWFRTGEILSPTQVGGMESFMKPYLPRTESSSILRVGAPLQDIPGLTGRRFQTSRDHLRNTLGIRNSVLFLSRFPADDSVQEDGENHGTKKEKKKHSSLLLPLLPPKVREKLLLSREWLRRLLSGGASGTELPVLPPPQLSLPRPPILDLQFFREVTAEERLLALLLALRVRHQLQAEPQEREWGERELQRILQDSCEWVAEHRDDFVSSLRAEGWNLAHLVVEAQHSHLEEAEQG